MQEFLFALFFWNLVLVCMIMLDAWCTVLYVLCGIFGHNFKLSLTIFSIFNKSVYYFNNNSGVSERVCTKVGINIFIYQVIFKPSLLSTQSPHFIFPICTIKERVSLINFWFQNFLFQIRYLSIYNFEICNSISGRQFTQP